ncbi:hypothetical protein CEUSTIGMA_g6626.t1 [Chlamydomonas eustigma]|uniref:Uncharacterized protein n=1 Tax=Chlamydomonas eustigma TaxID=1157962 RepID=A0A250X804_9CHLO|nr:hypothetical protein CEUSTIGMA_g6626.t1 [Chlamydomonas eustigma]|eukprot:GAX79186.1 hypothetical protein CEUSTIGMA_g6626.t1 [Chlamydomonas eustigma]
MLCCWGFYGECMEQPKHFKQSFGMAWIWAILVSVPQAYLAVLSVFLAMLCPFYGLLNGSHYPAANI